MMMRSVTFMIVFLVSYPSFLEAGQFVGGEIGYKVITHSSTDTEYEITFTMYRNCKSYAELNSPKIHILNSIQPSPFTEVYGLTLSLVSTSRMPYTTLAKCVINTPDDCFDLIVFKGVITLPISENGYSLYYTECCRDNPSNLSNASWNAGVELVGGAPEPGPSFTYHTTIPPQIKVRINNSPILTIDSVIQACINLPFNYKFKFIDVDGDSLFYAFGEVYGKSNQPELVLRGIEPAADFTTLSPMAGNPEIQLNGSTGELAGTPNRPGKFVVMVNIYEYRNGSLINIHRKEIQINAFNCNPRLETPPINCNDNLVQFSTQTNSTGLSYLWDFGVEGTNADTSTNPYPSFKYPAAGNYTIKLTLTNPAGCIDSIKTTARIYPGLKADFSWNHPVCNGTKLQLESKASFPYGNIIGYEWRYISGRGNVIFSNTNNPIFNYEGSDIMETSYSIQLTVTTDVGCKATLLQVPVVYPVPKAFAGPDTTLGFGMPYTMPVKANSDFRFLWDPGIGLNDPTLSNAVLIHDRDQRYKLKVSSKNGACFSYDTVWIKYAKGPEVYVPTAFTPNGDALNDSFGLTPVNVKVNWFGVYDRYGLCVFSTTNPTQRWDGKVKSVLQPPGLYTWIVKGSLPDGQPFVKSGNVMLIQ